MKSYMLAVALAMLVAAGFVFQNPGMVTVHFLVWSKELPQGVWEVVLFAAGAVLMWGVSLIAMMEERNRYRREIRDLDRRVTELREERDSLVNALNSFGPAAETLGRQITEEKWNEEEPLVQEEVPESAAPEETEESVEAESGPEVPEQEGRKWIPSWLSRKKKGGEETAVGDDWNIGSETFADDEEREVPPKEKEGDPDLS